jgi:hypothetical protein
MHLVLTSMKPSPPSRGAKYRVDNGTRKILPLLTNQTVTLYMRLRFSSPVVRTLCNIIVCGTGRRLYGRDANFSGRIGVFSTVSVGSV